MLPLKFYLEETAQLLAESGNFYLVHIDTRGNYDYMNDHFVERHRSFYKQNEVKPASIALHPDDHDLSYATYLNCIASPAATFDATLRKLDGKGGYVITYWEYKAYRMPDGELNGVIGIGYDITAFESRKDHIRFLTETLNRMKEIQSHDIRRPLANVLGLVEVLKMIGQDQDNSEVTEIAARLSQSCLELNAEFELFLLKDLPESLDKKV